MNEKRTKTNSSRKSSLKVQSLIENLHAHKSQRKVTFDEIFSNIRDGGKRYIFPPLLVTLTNCYHNVHQSLL